MKFWNAMLKKLPPYIPGEQPSVTGRVIKLNTNESPFGPSPKVVRAIRSFDPKRLRLYPPPNADTLCATIAARYGVPRENVYAGNGSDEILSDIFNAFASPKQTAVITDPTYTLYKTLAMRYQVPYRVIPTRRDFTIDLAAVPNKSSIMLFIANPNAQTGLLLPYEALSRFVDRFRGLVIADEAYIDFAGEGATLLPMLPKAENLIITRTFSKSFSLCGMRIGYAFASKTLVEGLYRVKDSYNLNVLSQIAATAAMDDYPTMQRNAAVVCQERTRMTDILIRRGYTVLPSRSNFILAKPPVVPAERLYKELKGRGIFIRYFDVPRLKDYVRITIGIRRENDALLAAMDDAPRVNF